MIVHTSCVCVRACVRLSLSLSIYLSLSFSLSLSLSLWSTCRALLHSDPAAAPAAVVEGPPPPYGCVWLCCLRCLLSLARTRSCLLSRPFLVLFSSLLLAQSLLLSRVCARSLCWEQDQVELLHEHMATLAARATQVNAQPDQSPSLDEGVQDAETEGGNSRNAHRKAYSVEEWRSLLAVRFVVLHASFILCVRFTCMQYLHT